MAIQERDPRAYELMTVFIPDLTDEDSQAEIEKIEGLVTANGGTMTETLTTSPWGRRRLAYTIRFNGVDYRDGIYTLFHFDMAPSSLTELEREMKLDTNLMRYLLVHDDPKVGEKFRDDEDGAEGSESEDQTGAAAADAGDSAAAVSQAASTGETGTAEAAATESETAETTESDASEAAPAEEAPAPETATDTTPAAETSEPAAAAAAPIEDASAADTTTDTAPPAADEAASDETEKE